MNSNIIELHDNNFQQYLAKANKIVLVDFWANWCNPCKILAPILEEIAEEYLKKLIIAKINIETDPKTAPQYSIRGIPALLLFKHGELIATKIGALSKPQLKDFLDVNLN